MWRIMLKHDPLALARTLRMGSQTSENGCEPLPGKGRLNTAEWWCRPSKGPPFTVPVEEDGRSDFRAIQRICDAFRDVPRLPLDD